MKIEVVDLRKADAKSLCSVWNVAVAGESDMYRPMSAQEFAERLAGLRDVPADLLVTARQRDALVGFAVGCTQGLVEQSVANLTALVVRPQAQGRGAGALLLERFEKEASAAGAVKVAVSPVSNVRLTWGVDPTTFGYPYLWRQGYATYETHLYMRRDLARWRTAASVVKTVDRLRREGVALRLARPEETPSLVRCARELERDAVGEIFEKNARRDVPHPVLVAVEAGKVVGFVGPLTVTPCGIPEFQLIAVLENRRGRGMGKALFSLAMEHFAERGATVMELMTDTDNPAQKVYFQAGFTHQRTFACMAKPLTSGD